MQIAHIRNKRHLYGQKIVVSVAIILCVCFHAFGQAQKTKWVKRNNPNYDNRTITYGFLIGLHTTAYQIKYSEQFAATAFDSLYAVSPLWSPGFSLGFIVNYRLEELWDLRLTPKVAFYEHKLRYEIIDPQDMTPDEVHTVETTMVEFPLLVKFKSERRENLRMYMIGGIKPAIEASGKKDLENVNTELEITGGNLSIDIGFGLDIYYPLFKFSPELRFSRGMVDILDNRINKYGVALDRVNTNTITLYLVFQ